MMWELVIVALLCGGSPGFLDKLGMMGVWAEPFGMGVCGLCYSVRCRIVAALCYTKKLRECGAFFV